MTPTNLADLPSSAVLSPKDGKAVREGSSVGSDIPYRRGFVFLDRLHPRGQTEPRKGSCHRTILPLGTLPVKHFLD